MAAPTTPKLPRAYRKSLAKIKRQRTARLGRLVARSYYLQQRGKQEAIYNLVCEEFVSLGGVYIKFLQGVLLNSPVMRKWHNPNKLKIFENLDIEPLDVIDLLQKELPPAKLAQISLVQPQPFAAGSFGQVYFGQLSNGKPIIIKVLRPMIRELLRHDLRLLATFSKGFVSREYPNMTVKMTEALKEFRVSTMRETDYVAEAEFADELYQAFKDHPTFVIPETYLDLCTPHLIVQDYVDGISGVELLKLKEQGVDPKEYIAERLGSDLDAQLETLGNELLTGVFELPHIQGDPHPGNVRFLKNNKVALIDFGISADSPANKEALFGIVKEWHKIYSETNDMTNLFEQFVRFFVSDLYKALRKLSNINGVPSLSGIIAQDGKSGDGGLTKELGRIMQEVLSSALGTHDVKPLLEDGRALQAFNQVVNKGNRFGLIVRLDASEILRAAQTYISLVQSLGRRKSVLPQVFAEVTRRVEISHPELMEHNDDSISIGTALEIISSWLERVAVRDPALFQQLVKRIKLKPDAEEVPQEVKEEPSA